MNISFLFYFFLSDSYMYLSFFVSHRQLQRTIDQHERYRTEAEKELSGLRERLSAYEDCCAYVSEYGTMPAKSPGRSSRVNPRGLSAADTRGYGRAPVLPMFSSTSLSHTSTSSSVTLDTSGKGSESHSHSHSQGSTNRVAGVTRSSPGASVQAASAPAGKSGQSSSAGRVSVSFSSSTATTGLSASAHSRRPEDIALTTAASNSSAGSISSEHLRMRRSFDAVHIPLPLASTDEEDGDGVNGINTMTATWSVSPTSGRIPASSSVHTESSVLDTPAQTQTHVQEATAVPVLPESLKSTVADLNDIMQALGNARSSSAPAQANRSADADASAAGGGPATFANTAPVAVTGAGTGSSSPASSVGTDSSSSRARARDPTLDIEERVKRLFNSSLFTGDDR